MTKKHIRRPNLHTPLAFLINVGLVRATNFLVPNRADEIRQLIAKRKVVLSPDNAHTSFDFRITKQGKIHTSVRGLEHLWAFIYCYQWLFDSAKTSSGKLPLHDETEGARTARVLLEWAVGDPRTEWPIGLPMPTDETSLVQVTNKIFLLSGAFIILHELGHLELGHLRSITNKPDKLIQREYEADDWAAQLVTSGNSVADLGGPLVAIALTFGLIGAIELEGKAEDVRTHPFPPDRIMHFISNHVVPNIQDSSVWNSVLLAAAIPIEANLLRKNLPSRWPLATFEEYFKEAKELYPS